ncbi:neuromedin-B-like [Rhineura floridana]|uniref:neuromedin-B-like n=1 Tax=Rhineura floridana TaxID=261503 RepID=UPI002AC7F51E|nr:neuromedin-B-like [Rhineura floridana]
MRAMGAAGLSGRILPVGGLAYLLLFATLSVSPSLEGPIRLRENLWATGHFMGKKSTLSSSHVQSTSLEKADPNNTPKAFSPVLTGVLEDMKDLLTREFLKILLQERLLEENRGKHDLKDQEPPSFIKFLGKYI